MLNFVFAIWLQLFRIKLLNIIDLSSSFFTNVRMNDSINFEDTEVS